MKKYFGGLILWLSSTAVFAAVDVNSELTQPNAVPAIIYAKQKAKLASPITGFIREINVKEGQHFQKGEPLVRYDCTILMAQKKQAKALLDKNQKLLQAHYRLHKLDSVSELDVAAVKADYETSQADFKIKQYESKQCVVNAPFAGQVVELFAHAHEYIDQGQPLIEITTLNDLYAKMIVPSAWLTHIKVGSHLLIKMHEVEKQIPATVSRIVYAIDPVSHTVTMFADLHNQSIDVIPGMSGEAIFENH